MLVQEVPQTTGHDCHPPVKEEVPKGRVQAKKPVTDNASSHQAQPEEKQSVTPTKGMDYIFWGFWVNLALVIATLTIAIFAVIQAQAVKASADVAKASVETLMNSERAWLVVTAESPRNLSRTKNAWICQGFGFAWRVKNCGRTPARIKRIGARFHSVKNLAELPKEPDIEIPDLIESTDHYPYGLIVAPGDSPIERFTMFNPPPTDDDIKALGDGTTIWIAYVVVEYTLVFDPELVRQTHVCYIYLDSLVGYYGRFAHSPLPVEYTKQT